MPKFRRFGGYGAYAEGWGLYAERLGKEMGFYQDPYSEFGRLSPRTVARGAAGDRHRPPFQALEPRTGDRVFPRQFAAVASATSSRRSSATSTIRARRPATRSASSRSSSCATKAQAALGDRFDIRDFHAVVLGNGALPLDVLEAQVDAYIASKQS